MRSRGHLRLFCKQAQPNSIFSFLPNTKSIRKFSLVNSRLLFSSFHRCFSSERISKSVRITSRPHKKPVLIGNTTPVRAVPALIAKPYYANEGNFFDVQQYDEYQEREKLMKEGYEIKDYSEIIKIRSSCNIAKEILKFAGTLVKPGITTEEIDEKVHEQILRRAAYPSPLNYLGYPKSMCTSVNEIPCHGVPDDRPLEEGDIVSIDITVFFNGYHGDTCATFPVGKIDDNAQKLIDVSRLCTESACKIVKPNQDFRAIGEVISSIAEQHGFSVGKFLCGHGIGKHFHDIPIIHHVRNNYDKGLMQRGMTFTIEPILFEGDNDIVFLEDQWTPVSVDRGWSAQHEHTVLVTDSGYEILT